MFLACPRCATGALRCSRSRPIPDRREVSKGRCARCVQTGSHQSVYEARCESIDRSEATLTLDPTLAFKLLRYINSPAFGLRVEVASFRHAPEALACPSAGFGQQRPRHEVGDVRHAAPRGLLMEELAHAMTGGYDEQMRNEALIRDSAERLLLGVGEINRAVLRALAQAA